MTKAYKFEIKIKIKLVLASHWRMCTVHLRQKNTDIGHDNKNNNLIEIENWLAIAIE